MDKFIWENEYSVGIQEIDAQHKYFFGVASEILSLAEKEMPTKDEVFEAINKLGNYAFYHFGIEEGYFDKFDYPNAAEHIAAHNQFREEIKKYFDKIRDPKKNTSEIAQEVAFYSGGWLTNHILEVDQKYTVYFHEHGLK